MAAEMKRRAPMKRTPLCRKTRIAPVSKRKRARSGKPGKLGIVRLYGKDMSNLREQCWDRDEGRCTDCSRPLYREERWDGDPAAFHLAHIRTKRNNGDTLDNVRALCGECHGKSHNAGGKPVPAKDQAA